MLSGGRSPDQRHGAEHDEGQRVHVAREQWGLRRQDGAHAADGGADGEQGVPHLGGEQLCRQHVDHRVRDGDAELAQHVDGDTHPGDICVRGKALIKSSRAPGNVYYHHQKNPIMAPAILDLAHRISIESLSSAEVGII